METVIVGGGYAGLVCALILRKYGPVTVIEGGDVCGGLLRTWTNSAGVPFDLGTHVFSDTGIPELDAMLFDRVRDGSWNTSNILRSGTYFSGRLSTNSAHIDARSLPAGVYEKGVKELLATGLCSPREDDTLESYLVRQFGRTFTDSIQAPVLRKIFNCGLRELLPGNFFQIKRLICLDAEETRRRKADPAMDRKLAFHSSSEGLSALKNYYPKAGCSGLWVQNVCAELVASGVRLVCGATVKSVQLDGQELKSVTLAHGEKIACDRLVWTGSPGSLLEVMGEDPGPAIPHRAAALYHFVFDRPFLIDNYYIICYDPSFRSFRITLYPNLNGRPAKGPFQCTVEAIGEEVSRDWQGSIREELIRMGILSPHAKTLSYDYLRVPGAFPLMTRAHTEESARKAQRARELSPGIELAGKAKLDAWSLNEVPVDAYKVATRLALAITA